MGLRREVHLSEYTVSTNMFLMCEEGVISIGGGFLFHLEQKSAPN
jgi:hypothetical protein